MPPNSRKTKQLWREIAAIVLSGILLVEILATHQYILRRVGFEWRDEIPRAALCVAFAAVAFAIRGVTLTGALAGFVVAFGFAFHRWLGGVGLLLAVFVLTWVATTIHSLKSRRDSGVWRPLPRDGLQVLANLGIAVVLLDEPFWLTGFGISAVAPMAVLASATADSVSSEIGEAFGGTPRLLTTMRRVPVGSNGAISLVGSLIGAVAAVFIALAAGLALKIFAGATAWSLVVPIVAIAGIAGMFFDSFLGATLEGRFLSNDAVNFLSGVFAGLISMIFDYFLIYPQFFS